MRNRWIVSAITLCLTLGATACFDREGAKPAGPRAEAPGFDLPLLSGRQIRLDELSGKIVILDFWATWCAPCEVQMPVLDEIWQDKKERAAHADDLMIVGVSVDTDPPAKVSDWIAERGFIYPIALGDQDLAMRYGVIGFPTLVIIDPSGGIHTRHTGVWSRPEIESVLDEIRAETPAQS